MQISQLVRLDRELAIVNDVQLAWFAERTPKEREDNAKLAREYVWTSEAVTNSLSSLDVLDRLRESLVFNKTNRFVCIATYGRGKSHLGLALANFFGRPLADLLVEHLLGNIAKADGVRCRSARSFKESRAPFLIVRLSGDEAGGLHQQFLSGLEAALEQHEATRGTRLPFWFSEARDFLDDLLAQDGPELVRADAALETHDLSVALLREEVAANSELWQGRNVHDLCIEAHRAARRTTPQFGGEVSLAEVLKWACNTFCSRDASEGKPCGGVLIVFDEFIKFVGRYARNPRGESLQTLLNGVSSQSGLAAFLALAQIDPDVAAKNEANQGGVASLTSLLTELNRLPQDDRFELFTSLETVLGIYLRHESDAWKEWEEDAAWGKERWDETGQVMALFKERYDGGARWSEENVEEKITSGCFPLHPVTTALLSSVTLSTRVAEARSAVGFIRWALEHHGNEPAVRDGRVNWIRPIALVPFFRDMLNSVGEWQQYQAALQSVGNERTPLQEACLQGILLHDVAGLKPTRAGGFVPLIALLTGYEESECQSALQDMGDNGRIRFDASTKRWMFLPPGESEEPVEEWIGRQVEGKTLDFPTLQNLPEVWKSWPDNPLKPLTGDKWNLNWANGEDFAAQVFLLTRAELSATNLKKLISHPSADLFDGLKLPMRGFLIHLLATNDEDVSWLRENAAKVLDEALKGQDAPPPVVLSLPREANSALPRLLSRRAAIAGMSESEARDKGKNTVQNVQTRLNSQLKTALEKRINDSVDFAVPRPYREKVEQAFVAAGARRLGDAVQSCYGEAFSQRPPELLTQYPGKTPSYRSGVAWIARQLVTDSVGSLSSQLSLRSSPAPGKDLVFTGPRPLLAKWNLLSGNGLGIQAPTGTVAHGWKVFDEAFAEGQSAKLLSDVFVQLLSPPYGYDGASLTLLVCAWYGRNRHLLSVTAQNTPVNMDTFWVSLDKPWEFLCLLSKKKVAWARRDANAQARQAKENIELVQKNEPIARDDAQRIEAQLRQYGQDDAETDTALREQALGRADHLKRDLESAQQYEERAGEIEEKILSARRASDLTKVLVQIGALPSPGLVPATRPLPARLTESATGRLTTQVENDCAKLETLSQLTDYSQREGQLRDLERDLKDHPQLLPRVQKARQTLGETRVEIEAQNHDGALLGEVRGMGQINALHALRTARTRLDALRPRAQSTRETVEATRKKLDEAASALESWAASLETRVAEATSPLALDTIKNEIMARGVLFDQTPEAALLQSAQQKATRLAGGFTSLEDLARSAAPALGAGPEAVGVWEQKIAALEAEDTTNAFLNDAARNRLATLRREMAQGAQTAKEGASAWLSNQKDAARNGFNPRALSGTLRAASPWLDATGRGELENLRAQVQERLESDEVGTIVERFRAISDPSRRAACLEQLRALQTQLESEATTASR